MDSLLIFAALFSASVTAFVIESYNYLVQDTGEVMIGVLLQISQQIANGTQVAAVRPPFQPASIDIAVNILWFLSLAFSLTCALAAVLVRQWARQYLRFPRSFSSTSEQARARQFVYENMEWWKMDVIVEMIPVLLHISLILFFIGLLLFARALSDTLATYLLCFCAIGGAAYTLLTTTPLVFSGCPYKTPFTGFLRFGIKGGTPLFRVIWISLATCFACVVLILCITPRFLIHRCFPSVSPVKPTWAMKMANPITSHLDRIIARIRATMSSPSLLEFFPNSCPSFKHILHRTCSLLSLPVSSVKRTTRAFSVALTERRQVFRDDLTIRDAHALQWAMEYSKRDTDLFDIVTSVPEFVELNNSAEVRMVLWKSGVLTRAVKLLHSCIIDNKVANKSVCMACLESIIVQSPCSAEAIEQDSHETDTFCLSSLITTFTCDEPTQLQKDNDIAQLAVCAISNIVLRRLYELEHSVNMTNEDAFQEQAETLTSAVSDIMRPLYARSAGRGHHRDHADPWQFFQLDHRLLNLGSWAVRWRRAPTSSVVAFCDSLRTLRSAWVTAWMKFHFSASASFHRLIWASLFDGTSHLQAFPSSSNASQHCVFMLTDKCFRMPKAFPDVKLSSQFSIYSTVLYGKQYTLQPHCTRRRLHEHFARSVHVYGGSQFGNSGDVVEIRFEKYALIINELASFLPKLARESNEHAWAHWDLHFDSVEFQDASAVAIRKMIHCRILRKPLREEELSVIVDAQHLSAVRILRRYSVTWNDLIDRTAEEFGYILQLDDDYNIDAHAELQFYDPDLFLSEYHTKSPYKDNWDDLVSGGWDWPTFQPDVW